MGDQITRAEHKKEKNKYPKKRNNRRKLLLRVMATMLLVSILLIAGLGVTVMAYVNESPELDAALLENPQSSTIYDMDKQKITDMSGAEYRKEIKIENVPKHVQDAFIAVEDVRFWQHNGIDWKRVAGAVVANITDGFGAEGGSTITQQLVKRSFLSPEKSIKRKLQEASLAKKMEEEYSKEQILEMYLNKVYFGEGAYGVETASKVYFGKSVKELSISEAALLAGLPQRPSGYNPFNHPDLAEDRRNTVLALMNKHEIITKEEMKEAQAIPVKEMLHKQKRKTTYDGFIDQVIKELKEKGITEKDLYTSGLNVYTTMDAKAQQLTDKVLTTDEYIAYPDDQFRAGVVLLDTKTGEIRAIGGDRTPDSEDVQKGFNYATQLKRQPGSTAKPIVAYGPVIEHLKWSTAEQIKDEEIELNGKVFKNWDDRFHGDVSMRTALQWSYNIPAIKALEAVGYEKAKAFVANLGIPLEEIYPSYAIGGFKHGLSPLQLAGAYAAFGNEGLYHQPHTVRKVVYPDGKEISFEAKPTKAMSDYTAYMVTDMLKTVMKDGTGQQADIPELPMAGKTGTNLLPENINGDGVTDSWFAGYTTRYTAAVWTGYDKTTQDTFVRKKDEVIAKLIFKQIMTEVSEGAETPDFTKPASVEEYEVDVETGKKATAYTPEDRVVTELFVKGTAPKSAPVRKQRPVKNNQSYKQKEKDKEKEQEEQEEAEEKKEEKEKEKEKEEKEKQEQEKEKQKEEKEKQKEEKEKQEEQQKEEQDEQQNQPDEEKPAEPVKPDQNGKEEDKQAGDKPDTSNDKEVGAASTSDSNKKPAQEQDEEKEVESRQEDGP